jgi:hypothetical protein
MGIPVKPGVSFSSYPHPPTSPQATPRHHHPLTNSLFHYLVLTQISQRLNPTLTQVNGQLDLSSPAVEPDLSPNSVHDPTRLTEQLDPNITLLLPRRVHLVKLPCAPHAALCPCSTSHRIALPTSRSSPCGPIFPFLLGREPKPTRSSFPKKIQTDSK